MGYLDNGVWNTDETFRTDTSGRFQRADSAFRSWITPDGSAGASGKGGFAAEA